MADITENSNITAFAKVYVPFLNHCQAILKAHSKLYGLGDSKNASEKLLRYMKFYNKTFEAGLTKVKTLHMDLWETVIDSNFRNILEGHSKLNWLTDKNIEIILGSNQGKVTECQILLSKIYKYALAVEKATEENLDGLPEEELENHQELIYSKILVFRIYEVLLATAYDSEKTQKALVECLVEIETDLGIDKPKYKKQSSGGGGDGMSQLMNMASSVAKQMGVPIPEDAQMPQTDQMMGALSDIMNRGETQNIISDLKGSFQNQGDGPPDFGKIISTALGSVMRNVPMENSDAIKETINDLTGQVSSATGQIQKTINEPSSPQTAVQSSGEGDTSPVPELVAPPTTESTTQSLAAQSSVVQTTSDADLEFI